MVEPIAQVNGLGKIRYQPRLESGRILCLDEWFGGKEWIFYSPDSKPVLYRSKSRAIRVANREQRRISKNNWERLMANYKEEKK